VKDVSGGVLPGVTVEAASPVLIEKVRSVTTDATGQYRIVDLRPGAYVVTFTVPGFKTVKRDGITLTGTFVATVSVELAPGGLDETITVTGQSPVVDVQSVRVQQTMSRDVFDHPILRLPNLEIPDRCDRRRRVAGLVHESHQAFSARRLQGLQQDRVDDRKDRGVRTDPERQCYDRDESEPRRLTKLAESEL